YARHDRSIRDAKVVDAIDFEEAIHHTPGVLAHLGGGRLMPKAKCCVADVVFQLWTFQVVGNDLSPDKMTESAAAEQIPVRRFRDILDRVNPASPRCGDKYQEPIRSPTLSPRFLMQSSPSRSCDREPRSSR